MTYMFYNKAPFVIITNKGSGIAKPKDLEGRTVGSPPGAAALKLFPALAKKAGVDNAKIQWVNMAPQLQEQMLLRGDVQASLAFINTSWFNFKRVNVDPEKDLTWLFYSDFGLDLYSNGMMVSKKLAQARSASATCATSASRRRSSRWPSRTSCRARPQPARFTAAHSCRRAPIGS